MGVSDKVLQAVRFAKQASRFSDLKFEVIPGSVVTVGLPGRPIFEFDSIQEANQWAATLNTSMAVALSNLSVYYDQKVTAILNA